MSRILKWFSVFVSTLLTLSLVFAASASAAGSQSAANTVQQPVPIVSYFIPGLVNKDKTGSMVEMLDRVSEIADIEFDLQLIPTKRVQDSFKRGNIFGYFPALSERRHKPSCRTANLMQKKIIVVTRKDSPPITEVAQLEGIRVGAVSGYSYGEEIIHNENINIEYVRSDVTNTRKLATGRIDAIVGDAHSTINAIVENNLQDEFWYDPDTPVTLLDVFFVFQDTEEGTSLCDSVSIALEQLRAEGALKKWFDYE